MSHRVLITGIGGNVGQGVLKALRAGSKKFHIVGIDMEPLSAGFSLVDSYYQTPRTSDPAFPGALRRITRKEQLEAIYVCSPAELASFSTHKEALEQELRLSVFVNPLDVILTGSDKLQTAEFLRNAGFPAPDTTLATNADGVERLIERHGFPLIVKPRAGFSSRNVFLVQSRLELEAASQLVPDLIVQQYLPDDSAELTAATLSGADKKVRALIVLRRDLLQGTTYRTELVADDKLNQQVVQIVEALGAVGPCNLQFRLLAGVPYVFEINPRFSGTSGIRYLYGFNDCEMIFDLLRLGIEVKQPPLQKAVVLRYWNEVCIPDATFESLRAGRQHDGFETMTKGPRTVGEKA
ncbi:MAG TPA: ATP-grasp domain-containing protein [Pyrinomonadaceae bacterium]|nr:ATP-grasp domain-containing protein [Pyrinomonadaceae bacterium]